MLRRYLIGVTLAVGAWLVVGTVSSAPPKPSVEAKAKQPQKKGARMDPKRMREIVEQVVGAVKGDANVWEFTHGGVQLMLVYDETHDRMRIITPIADVADVPPERLVKAMEANFHSALDARYGSSRGVLYGAFLHPLSSLHPDELRSAISQVANLALTFGTHYSSGELIFGG